MIGANTAMPSFKLRNRCTTHRIGLAADVGGYLTSSGSSGQISAIGICIQLLAASINRNP